MYDITTDYTGISCLVLCIGIERFVSLCLLMYKLVILTGIHCFSLSSSPSSSEDGHITVCPGTTVTLTCTANRVGSLRWSDQNGQMQTFLAVDGSITEDIGPYRVSLVAADNLDPMTAQADFNSTLEVTVDDNISNETNITCLVFGHRGSLLIYKRSETN